MPQLAFICPRSPPQAGEYANTFMNARKLRVDSLLQRLLLTLPDSELPAAFRTHHHHQHLHVHHSSSGSNLSGLAGAGRAGAAAGRPASTGHSAPGRGAAANGVSTAHVYGTSTRRVRHSEARTGVCECVPERRLAVRFTLHWLGSDLCLARLRHDAAVLRRQSAKVNPTSDRSPSRGPPPPQAAPCTPRPMWHGSCQLRPLRRCTARASTAPLPRRRLRCTAGMRRARCSTCCAVSGGERSCRDGHPRAPFHLI